MAKLGVRKFNDLIGQTQFLKLRDDLPPKTKLLNFARILLHAKDLRPNTNILGGSVAQVRLKRGRHWADIATRSSGKLLV